MKFTKVNIDRRLISVLIYAMAALGGYIPMLLLAGYVFIYEKDERLELDIMMSFSITIVYSILKLLIGYIPVIINWILFIFSIKTDISFLSGVVKVITEIIEFVRLIIIFKLAIDAYRDSNRELLYKIFKVEN